MTKLESEYKKAMCDAINREGGYATRIEDQYRVGVLDMILSMPETGIILAEAKRFTGQQFSPSLRQQVELVHIERGGGHALMIGVKEGKHYLSGPNLSDKIYGVIHARDCVIQEDGESFPELFVRWFKEEIKPDE